MARVRVVRLILFAVLFAVCGAAAAPAVLASPAIAAPVLPKAAVVAAAEGELTLDVAELI